MGWRHAEMIFRPRNAVRLLLTAPQYSLETKHVQEDCRVHLSSQLGPAARGCHLHHLGEFSTHCPSTAFSHHLNIISGSLLSGNWSTICTWWHQPNSVRPCLAAWFKMLVWFVALVCDNQHKPVVHKPRRRERDAWEIMCNSWPRWLKKAPGSLWLGIFGNSNF